MASLLLAIIPGLEKEIDSRIEAELGKDIVGNKKKTRRQVEEESSFPSYHFFSCSSFS